jgi:NDP-sugar pyrophosphorylase family protein
VEEQLGDGRAWGVSLKFAYDGPVPLGTGGALLNALPLLGSRFLVMYGDAYLDCDYQEVIRAFAAAGTLGLMTVYRNRGRWDTSNVHFQNGTIEAYDKRRPTSSMEHIDYGLGMLQASALEPYRVGEPLDLATVYQDLLAKNQLAGFEVTQRFYEIGSESGLAETRNYFLSRDRKSRP